MQDPILLWGSLGSPWPATLKEISHAYHWDVCVTQGCQEQQYLDLECVVLLTPFNLRFLIDLENSFHVFFPWILLWVNPPILPSRLSHPTHSSLFKHFAPQSAPVLWHHLRHALSPTLRDFPPQRPSSSFFACTRLWVKHITLFGVRRHIWERTYSNHLSELVMPKSVKSRKSQQGDWVLYV